MTRTALCTKVALPVNGCEKSGRLIALEGVSETLPFDLNRVYYIYGVSGDIRRGFHAHKQLKQLLVCVSGSCEILLDNGIQKETIAMSSPDIGVLIERPLWREMYGFSSDCVLMVLASEHYDTEDYIWDYQEFLKFVGIHDV